MWNIMTKKRAKAKPDRVSQKKTKSTKRKTAIEDWCKSHKKKILLVSYYSGAAIVISLSIYVIMSNLTKTEDVTRDEAISFFTEYVDDNDLELGTEEVEREGEDGVKKVKYKEESYLLGGEVISSSQIDFEITKEPVSKIVRRGTRRWQYMICSDGSWRYYTDEQLNDKNVGFTHASEDSCAKNGQGTAVALSDIPPNMNTWTNTSSGYQDYSDSSYTPVYADLSNLGNRDFSEYDLPESDESTNDANNYYESAEKYAQQAKIYAQNACMSEANTAGRNVRAQLGAVGGQVNIDSEVDRITNSTYQDCMRRNGY